jgi:hypothetical protein
LGISPKRKRIITIPVGLQKLIPVVRETVSNRVQSQAEGEAVRLGLGQAIPAALLVNELLSVACEAETVEVTLTLAASGGTATLSPTGLDWHASTASVACPDELSGHLIAALLEQLGGGADCDDPTGRVIMTFKMRLSDHTVTSRGVVPDH